MLPGEKCGWLDKKCWTALVGCEPQLEIEALDCICNDAKYPLC